MPVTIHPHKVEPSAVQLETHWPRAAADASQLLLKSLPGEIPETADVYQSTWGHGAATLPGPVLPTPNGLIDSVRQAYAQHHHLVLRPEHIWFAILTQLALYINAHSEELRSLFVKHEGKQKIRLEYNPFSRYDFDFGGFANDVGNVLKELVVDSGLRDWIMPDFTTTDKNDRVVASIIMMGSLQKYFDFECGIICGFPSVTLLGEKSDYETILQKIDKLEEFGDEPRQFAEVLRPVVKRFIQSFDNPTSKQVVKFWKTAFDVDDSLCGVTWYTGWITAFCFWDMDGKCLRRPNSTGDSYDAEADSAVRDTRGLTLDGVKFHGVDAEDVPPAYTRVPVKVESNEGKVEAEMFAGLIGIALTSRDATNNGGGKQVGEASDSTVSDVENRKARSNEPQLDTMAPVAGWWISEDLDKRARDLQQEREAEMYKQLDEMRTEMEQSGDTSHERHEL